MTGNRVSGDVIHSFICMVISKHFQQRPTTAIVHSNNTNTHARTLTLTLIQVTHGSWFIFVWHVTLAHNLFVELNLFMVKNGEKYYIVSFIAISYLCLSTSVFACAWTWHVLLRWLWSAVCTTHAKSILQYVILHFIFSTFNHSHTMRTTTMATQ